MYDGPSERRKSDRQNSKGYKNDRPMIGGIAVLFCDDFNMYYNINKSYQ